MALLFGRWSWRKANFDAGSVRVPTLKWLFPYLFLVLAVVRVVVI